MITQKLQREFCFGCGACTAVCSAEALQMKADAYGFLYPELNAARCTGCGQCLAVCPALVDAKNSTPIAEAYAVRGHDAEHSASGSVFYTLAKTCLEKDKGKNKTYFAGAVWNNSFLPEITVGNSLQDLEKMRGSKYVHADTGTSYRKTKELLEAKNIVLYSGTPCQIAGLKNFLGKDYNTLLTMELLCHGGGSPLAWQKYLQYAEKKYHKPITDSKCLNSKNRFLLYFADGTAVCENLREENEYFRFYGQNKFTRPSCFSCPFNRRRRCGDLVLGDIWASWAEEERKKGISLVIVNSEKAKYFLKSVPWEYFKPFDINDVKNHPLNKINGNTAQLAAVRELALDKIRGSLPFENLYQNKKAALMNFNYPRDNYGALLLAYALEKTLRRMGYEPHTVNYYKNPYTMDFDPRGAMWKFRENFLTLHGFYTEKNQLPPLNAEFDKFIFGSDVIWKDTREYVYFADWVNGKNTLIAYAASFCENKMPEQDEHKKACMRRFDAVSVREKSGIAICRDYAGVEASHVIDPSLLLEAKDYEEIIGNEYSEIPSGDFIAHYTFWQFDPYALLKHMPVYNAFKNEQNKARPFGQWLNMVKNCRFFITSSYHGVCFALLYSKNFVYLRKPGEDNERVNSLFETLGLDKRLILNHEREISKERVYNEDNAIHYAQINQNIAAFRQFSLNWLEKALQMPPSRK